MANRKPLFQTGGQIQEVASTDTVLCNASSATSLQTVDDTLDASCFILFANASGTTSQQAKTNPNLKFDAVAANTFSNNALCNATFTTSASGTTILTSASTRFQALTGSLNQTFQLPDATTLSLAPWFVFNNNSSGSLIITNAGGTTLYTVPAGGVIECGPTSIGTANGAWDFHGLYPSTVSWSSGTSGLIFNNVLNTTPQILAGASSSTSPSFIPQRGSSTTGYGGDSTHLYAIIGGTAALTITAAGTTAPALDTTAANYWSEAQGTVLTSLTDAATIALDLSQSNAFQVQLGGNRTLGVPTGLVAGRSQDFKINVYQDGTGSRTLTYPWCYKPVITGLSTGKYQFDQLFGTVNRYATATVTMTIATPCVVTWTGFPMFSGEIVQFTTTGALPTGVSANTSYWINSTGANTFNLATSLANLQAGLFVASSGSQSGTHTGTSISITISPILGLA